MKQLFRLVLLVVLYIISPPSIAAEVSGQIRGTVVDDSGMEVPGVVVTVTSDNLIGERAIETAAEGTFRAAGLPPGEYTVEAVKPGFNTWRTTDIGVVIGGVVTLEVSMSLAEAGEVLIVTASAPTVDIERTQTGLTMTAEMMQDIPSNRDYQGVVGFAPGVVGSGNANMHGGFDSSNQFYIDGVNTTDPITSTFSMNMNFDAIQEVQVITGGMDAEYGRALGGAVNIVTQSGGNDYEGYASVTYSDSCLEAPDDITESTRDSACWVEDEEGNRTRSPLSQYETYALNLGGPVIEDKLWFFTSLQADRSVSTLAFDNDVIGRPTGPDPINGLEMSEVAPRDWRSLYWFGKLTWQPNSANRVWAHVQGDPTWIDNVSQSPYVLPSAEAVQNQGGWLGSLGHLWMPTNNLQVESKVYYQQSNLDYYSILWQDCQVRNEATGACDDDFGDSWYSSDPDGFDFGEIAYASFNERNRISANSAVSWFVDNLLGSHAFKTGVQFERLISQYSYPGISNGLDYYSHSGDPADLSGYTPTTTYRYRNDWDIGLDGSLTSWYLQDVWQPIDNLTIRPGLRMDHSALDNDIGETVFTSLTWAPRLGVAWDVFGDQSTSVHAYFGRFYDSGFLAVADLLVDNDGGYDQYSWEDQTGGWSDIPTQSSYSQFLAHDDLKNPHSDEWDFGVTRAIGEAVAIDITWVHKEASNFWEDDEVNLLWNPEGTAVIGNRNGSNEAIYRLRTADDLWTKYDSLEVSLNKRWSDYWGATGSYTWSRATGTNSDHIATGAFDTAEQRQYEQGNLAYDRTHAVKFMGSYRRPDVWQIGSTNVGYLYGWDFRLYSGTPLSKLYYNEFYSGWANYGEVNDGTYRLPAYSQTDIKTGLMFKTAGTTFALTFECFNLFNERTPTSMDETWGARDGDGVYLDSNNEPLWGTPLSYQNPRRFQVGLRGEF